MRTLVSKQSMLIVLLAAVFVTASFSLDAQRLEQRLFHWFVPVLPAQNLAESPVVTIVLDDDSRSHFGNELYSHDLLARLVRKLHDDKAATIALALPLDQSQTSPEMANLRRLLKDMPAGERNPLRSWADRLDPDQRLAQAIARAGNVVLLAPLNESGHYWKNTLPSRFYLQPASVEDDFIASAREVLFSATMFSNLVPVLPDSVFLAQAARLGFAQERHKNLMALPLFYPDRDKLLPSFTLSALAHFMKIDLQDIKTGEHGALRAGFSTWWTGPGYYFAPYPSFTERDVEKRMISLARYMNQEETSVLIRDKLVVIALDAGAHFTDNDPVHRDVPRAQQLDVALNSLLSDTYITIPDWFIGLQRLLLAVLAVCLLIITWRFSHRTSLIIVTILVILLVNAWVIGLSIRHMWLPVAFPLAFLLIAQLILSIRTIIQERIGRLSLQVVEARSALARNLQSQGQLDQAMDELAKCPQVAALREPLYQLALDLERRRFAPKALEVYRRIAAIDAGYRDIADRRRNLENVPSGPLAGRKNGGGSTMIATMVANSGSMAKPMLGRYQIEHELGQGAMGVVYLGVDPKIGRKVAIKTLSLMDEFEGEDLKEAQERFFREAEAAGRLDHPNIITIYDAGEEHDLAYIAMDYAPGDSLDNFVRKGQLLPIKTILGICASVAEALDYAHSRNVVHRDIKPSNIIYDSESGSVKITDFGIAFLADDSKTRSGLILGSPSYMSPEQVAGRKLDGRSDLYSLGVTMYQLLTGQLPFSGDSLANLMYKITHDKYEAVSKLRKNVPTCAVRIVNKALQKEAGKRYQSGADMAEALERCGG